MTRKPKKDKKAIKQRKKNEKITHVGVEDNTSKSENQSCKSESNDTRQVASTTPDAHGSTSAKTQDQTSNNRDSTDVSSATVMTTRSQSRHDDYFEIEFVVFISPEFRIEEDHCQIGLITSFGWKNYDRFLSELNIIGYVQFVFYFFDLFRFLEPDFSSMRQIV